MVQLREQREEVKIMAGRAEKSGKVGVVVQADPDVVKRLDALRIVLGTSRARVSERAWVEGGIGALEVEQTQNGRLPRLYEVARRRGLTWQEYVDKYARDNKNRTYGPRLEELERTVGITPVATPR